MTSVTVAVQKKAVCGPFCFITSLKLRHWKIPPDITTEETERALTASCLT